MSEPIAIGPLQPGTYVLEVEADLTDEEIVAMVERWKVLAPPDCHVIVLAGGVRIARTEPLPSVDDARAQVAAMVGRNLS